jgi:autotransporter-like protein
LVIQGGTSTGTTTVNLTNANNPTGVILQAPIPVISSPVGSNLQSPVTPQTSSTLAAASNGLVTYNWSPIGPGSWGVSNTLNTGAIIGPASSVVSTLASIDSAFHQSASSLVASAPSDEPDKWTGGMWVRGSAGVTTVKSTATDLSGATQALTGAAPTNLSFRTTYEGYQAGFDTGRLNWGSTHWNAHIGVSAGEVDANANEQTGTLTSVKYNVPFVTLYGVLTSGAFFSDLSFRHDFFDAQVSNPFVGLYGQDLKGYGNNITGSAGYLLQLGKNFFEPSIGLSASIDQFNDLPLNVGNTTVKFNEFDSELARAGFRTGTSIVAGDWGLQPFVAGSIWHEFAEQSTAQFIANANTANAFTVPIGVSRVGTFFQGGVGIAAQLLNTGFIGYIRGDARAGENITGYSIVGGARYTF